MASLLSNATPAMLKWARESMHLDIESVAAALRVDAQKLRDWETGKGSPSLSVLRKLAERYKRPLMVFYLSAPPKGFSVVRDFRILPKGVDPEFSPELAYAIRQAQERQAWASEFLADAGMEPSTLVGSAKLSDDPSQVGVDLRKRLGITLAEQSSHTAESAAYSWARRLIERAGVFVFQASRIEVKEMRGFALPDKFAPAIVVNIRDGYRPKLFTLMHELAHVQLNEPALSGAGKYAISIQPRRPSERFCNVVAAETLMPTSDFRKHVPSDWEDNESEVVKKLSRRYWTSLDAVRLRLVELGFADSDYFKNHRTRFVKPAKTDAHIPVHTLAIARSGESYSRMAISAYREGALHGGELSSLLGASMKHLPAMEKALFPKRIQTGK